MYFDLIRPNPKVKGLRFAVIVALGIINCIMVRGEYRKVGNLSRFIRLLGFTIPIRFSVHYFS